jgi:diadenosine tetraphosphate (Ap4A) HIT family hydrolase
VLRLTVQLRELLKAQYSFDGINLGLNNGVSAGQTIPHTHLHVIPRYTGDAPDPRGGVRRMFPDRAAFWSR